MHADLEFLTGLVRVFKPGKSRQNQDPYEWSATIRWVNEDTIEVMGVDKPMTIAIWRSLIELLGSPDFNINHVVIVRHGRHKTLSKVTHKGGRVSYVKKTSPHDA